MSRRGVGHAEPRPISPPGRAPPSIQGDARQPRDRYRHPDGPRRVVTSRQIGAGTAAGRQRPDRLERRFGENMFQDFALDHLARKFDTPALIFHDPDDTEVPYQDAEAVAAAWRTASLVEASGLGHHRILRYPAVVNRTVRFVSAGPHTGQLLLGAVSCAGRPDGQGPLGHTGPDDIEE